MRILKITNGHFTRLAYARAQSLLTINTDRVSYVTRLWNLSLDADPVDLPGKQAHLVRLVFRHGGARFLHVQGTWPDGEPLPLVEQAERIESLLVADSEYWVPFAFGPDGRTILYRHAGVIDETYQTHFYVKYPNGAASGLYRAWGMFTTSAAFSPNGRLVAMSSGTRFVAVWDVIERKELHLLEQGDKTNALAFISDDQLVVAAGRSVQLWNANTGQSVSKFRAFRKYADALAISHDRKLFAAGSRDGFVRVWDSASGREVKEYEWGVGEVRDIAFSPEGTTAAAAGVSAVAVWDID